MEKEASSSGHDPKRGHHWLEDASYPNLSTNKKETREAFTSKQRPRFPDVNLSLSDYNSRIQSGVGMYYCSPTGSLPEPVKNLYPAAKNVSINNASNAGKAKVVQVRDFPKEIPVSMGHSSSSEIDLTLSLSMACNDGAGLVFNKAGGNFMSMGHTINNRDGNLVLTGLNSNTEVGTISLGESAAAGILENGRARKNKEQKMPKTKKLLPNRFPSNVKALLSTGILDGVPVKYVSWSRDKDILGIIKGTAYLCGCKECNFSKVVTAFELEGHAGGKTKHPNNHIYFQNGKTIFAAVQELQSTPKENLFNAIQTLTGSPINKENFSTWKASYEVASRELRCVYGKDDVAPPFDSRNL